MWGRPREGSCVTREAGDTSHLLMPYNLVCMARVCTHAARATALQWSQVCGKDLLGWNAPGFCGHTGKSVPQRGSDAKKPQGGQTPILKGK